MRHIKTQEEFDALVASTPTTEKVLIYAIQDGTTYKLSAPWNIPSNSFIGGVNAPVIEYTGTLTSNSGNLGLLNVVGSSSAPLSNITIRDLVLKGNSSVLHGINCDYVGVAVKPTSNSAHDSTALGSDLVNTKGITIEDCFISGFAQGIRLLSAHNNTLIGNITQNNTQGLNITSSRNTNIIDNIVQNNATYGIYMVSASNNTIIHGNTMRDNGEPGIYINKANNIIITSNIVQNNGTNGIHLLSTVNNTVSGNTIFSNGNDGIFTNTLNNSTINGNVIMKNEYSGINFSRTARVTVSGNTIMNNTDYGVYCSSTTSNNVLTANNISSNGTGVEFVDGSVNNMLYSNVLASNEYHYLMDNTSGENTVEEGYNLISNL